MEPKGKRAWGTMSSAVQLAEAMHVAEDARSIMYNVCHAPPPAAAALPVSRARNPVGRRQRAYANLLLKKR